MTRRTARLLPGQMLGEYPEREASMPRGSDELYEKLFRLFNLGQPGEPYVDALLRAAHLVQNATGFTLPVAVDLTLGILREFDNDRLSKIRPA